MKELFILLDFGGYTALLVWGVHMVQTGVQRAYGANLRVIMGRALRTRIQAFFSGLGITAIIQSSTATGLMISSFAAGGIVALQPGLAAMLGANVGTTIIVQLLSFNLTLLAPALILAGVWAFRRYEPGRRRDLGRALIGLGLLLLALHELVGLLAPVQTAPWLQEVLDALTNLPVLALLLAAALTWAAHSSVAVVVLVMSLASHNLVTPSLAYALVLGANLGTAFNPVLESPRDGDPASRRLPLGNLGTRIVGCAIALLLLPWVPKAMDFFSQDIGRSVANFHTLFNILIALLFLPMLRQYSSLLERLLPKRLNPDDPARILYLDQSAHEVPSIALGNAAREALRVADLLQSLLNMARANLRNYSRHRRDRAQYLAGVITHLEASITTYLATMDQDNMNKDDHRRRNDILAFISNVARAASAINHDLLDPAERLAKKGWSFNTQQLDELLEIFDRLLRNQRRMAALFVAEDLRGARYLAYEKDYFRKLEMQSADRHLQDIQSGKLEHAEVGSYFLEVLRDAKAVNTYLVEAAAYPILARYNALLPNRLREDEV